MLYSLKKQFSVSDIHLLVACTDAQTLKLVFSYFESMGYQLDSASDSEEVRSRLRDSEYDALILDSQLSEQNGVPLYTSLRLEYFNNPIILLVPDAGTENLPRYLNSGADDIVTAPLHLLELEARVLARIRLAKAHLSIPRLSWAGIVLDLRTHIVMVDSQPLHLQPMAFRLLARLMKEAPNIVTRNDLQKELYGDSPPNSDALRTYIHILRTKLAEAGKPILQTVPRVGFRLTEE